MIKPRECPSKVVVDTPILTRLLEDDSSAKVEQFKEFLDDPERIHTIAFLIDITDHLNKLNVTLQGRQNTICNLMSEAKIEMFIRDLPGQKVFFENLKKFENDHPRLAMSHIAFIEKLKKKSK